MDQEPSWQRQLVIGLSALLAIALLIGGVLAVIAVKAADYAGLGDGNPAASTSSPDPILPTTGEATKTAGPPTRNPPSTTPTHRKPQHHGITLTASPAQVPSYGRINLIGSYPGHDGARLQVQRSIGDGAFSDFPTSTSVSNGAFGTYIQTSMVGVNHIRMIDPTTGATSNVVTVRVG